MKKLTKKNLPLIIGLAIPVVMIVVIALVIYLPGLYAPKPQYNFLYASGTDGPYGATFVYSVSNGHLAQSQIQPTDNQIPKPVPVPANPTLYLYNVSTNQALEISFADAQKLNLDPSSQSADGYEVAQVSGGGGFPFGGPSDYNTRYLKGHGASIKLNLKTVQNMYSYNGFQFLGWIEK